MKVMMINSLDGTRRRGLRDAREDLALAMGEADELIGELVEAAESGHIDAETYTRLLAEYDSLRLTPESGFEAHLERVRVWLRETKKALGIGAAKIALGIGAGVLILGGAVVWYIRRKR